MIPSYIQRFTKTYSTTKTETKASSSSNKKTPVTKKSVMATKKTAATMTQKRKAMQKPTPSKKLKVQSPKKPKANETPKKSRASRKTTKAQKARTKGVKKRHRRPPLYPGFELNPDFICDPCAMILEDKKHYLQHMLTFHAFNCDCCRKRFLSKYMLQKHVSAQLEIFPEGLKSVVPITVPGVASITVPEIELFDPSGAKRFSCLRCSVAFEDKEDLKQHKTDAHWKYKCTMCEQLLSTPGTLEYHMRGHTGVRPFACNQCEQKFTANPVLLKHIATCHSNPPGPANSLPTLPSEENHPKPPEPNSLSCEENQPKPSEPAESLPSEENRPKPAEPNSLPCEENYPNEPNSLPYEENYPKPMEPNSPAEPNSLPGEENSSLNMIML